MNAITDNPFRGAWRELGTRVGRPSAILCVSAHWCTRGVAVTAMRAPPTIHDFHGFPPELHEIVYPAPGSPELARRIGALLGPEPVAMIGEGWGLDHGAWQVLMHLIPDASVPVVQLSLDMTRSARDHLALARRLAPLREEGVLVLGSGNVVHNLMAMDRRADPTPPQWASAFRDWTRECVVARDADALSRFEAQGAQARLSAPTPEHFLPLLYALAVLADDEVPEVFADAFQGGTIAMLSFAAGSATA